MDHQDCIFCRIIRGEIPAYKIAENEDYLAFLDIAQFTEGHTIVIPKKHYEFIWDVEDIASYMEFVQKIGNHYRKLGYKYVDTLTFGRMINHCHIHLVPHDGENEEWRNALSRLGEFQKNPERRINKEQGEKLAEKLKYAE
jgi:histidine triad (HIT) family protein